MLSYVGTSKYHVFKIITKCVKKYGFVSHMIPKKPFRDLPVNKLKRSYQSTKMHKTPTNLESPKGLDASSSKRNKPDNECSKNRTEKTADEKIGPVNYLDTPVKSANDKKDYRVIKLPNGLTALLISDLNSLCASQSDSEDDEYSEEDEEESTDEEISIEEEEEEEEDDDNVDACLSDEDVDTHENKRPRKEEKLAACGLCVGVGSFSDPPEIPGMAHFLEHMVFMGSEKYPEENDFDAFIRKRGGSDNASTQCEQTTFHFEIPEKHLLDALDRFAQFFISPLMKRDAITRERESIESEFQMALPSDFYRKEQLFCSFAQAGHPANKFTWGNLVSLRDNVSDDKLYEEVHKFRQRHYSAHRMTLALQARLSLDTLEQYVKDCFSNVPSNGLPADDFSVFKGVQSFDTPNFKRMYKIKPVKDSCQIELTWVMPSLRHLYKCKPHQYLSWIVGHEGKGSLIGYLRNKMWCLDIFSGNGESGFEHSSMYALFSLCLILTDEGHKHLKEVLDAVFSYINLLRRSGPQKRIYDEIYQTEETSFRFIDETSASDYVETLSENMHLYAPADYITGSDLHLEYNPVEIKACMDALIPESVNVIIFDKKFNDANHEKVEPWFGTKYTDTEIPPDWIKHWQTVEPFAEFHLPEPNIFLTDDFSLISLPADMPKYPVKVHCDAVSEVWYKPDSKFKIPECYMNFNLISPLALTTPENAAMTDLLVIILKQLLVEELYPANAAELSHQIYPSDKGITVKVNGFNQKLPLLLATIMKHIADCSKLITPELFHVMKTEQIKGYYNTFLKPGKLVKDIRLSIILLVHWTAVERHAAITNMEYDQFITFVKYFIDRMYIQCLIQGNITKEDVERNAINCVAILKGRTLLPHTMPQLRVLQIPLGVHYCRVKSYSRSDVNSVVTNYYQSGVGDMKTAVMIELLVMIMEEPLFDKLRTQEQLGYNVFCLMRDTFGILGYSITICTQANKFSTSYVDERIEIFLKTFMKTLKKMSDEELNEVKIALVNLKQCVDLHLKEEVDRNWAEITTGEYTFDRIDREISAINSIKLGDLIKWMERHVLGGSNLRKLSVQVIGSANANNGSQTVLDSEQTENTEQIDVSSEAADSQNIQALDSAVDYRCDIKFPIQHVTTTSEQASKKVAAIYITDIEEYKHHLYTYPAIRTTAKLGSDSKLLPVEPR